MQWASDLARMVQVSLVGYFVGGAFLSLAYYDVPYNLLVALVLTRELIEKEVKGAAQKQGVPMSSGISPAKGSEQGVVSITRLEPQIDTDEPR
jgi:hypothetical protein